MGSKEYLSRNLFGGEPPARGEEGFLEPGFRLAEAGYSHAEAGFHFDEQGQIVDAEGNVHDEECGLVREAPSERKERE